MDEVSGERLVRLNEHQDVLADVIDVTAQERRSSMHARMAEANAISATDGGRFEELRALIENAIIEQRQSEAEHVDRREPHRLGGRGASPIICPISRPGQSSISERRRGRAGRHGRAGYGAAGAHAGARPHRVRSRSSTLPLSQSARCTNVASKCRSPAAASQPASSWTRLSTSRRQGERPPAWDIPSLPVAPSQPSQAAADADDDDSRPWSACGATSSPMPSGPSSRPPRARPTATKGETTKDRRPMAADVAEAASNSVASLRSRLFGVSPKLCAAALGLIVAINGGLSAHGAQNAGSAHRGREPEGAHGITCLRNAPVPPRMPRMLEPEQYGQRAASQARAADLKRTTSSVRQKTT